MTNGKSYVGPDQWVKKVGERADGSAIWQAGPRSKAYETNQIVPNSYAEAVRGSIDFRNRVMGLVDNPSEETPDNYADAQDAMSEFYDIGKELQKDLTDEERERLERELDNLRADLGS